MMLNVEELSKELGMSKSGIYQWVGQRKIPFVKIGRTVRFDPQEIHKWLADNSKEPRDVKL